DDNPVLGQEEMDVLKSLCGDDCLHYELTRELLSIERQQRATSRRAGLFDQLEKSFRRHFYDNKDEAVETARRHAAARAQSSRDLHAATDQVEQPSLNLEPSN